MSATTHEAVLGGARWRLTLHPDGRWDLMCNRDAHWDDIFAGGGGVSGAREAATDLEEMSSILAADGPARNGAAALRALADVAERSTTP